MSDYQALTHLTPEQQDQIGYALVNPNPAAALSPYIIGLFMDSVLLGVLIMQSTRWFAYCFSKERITTRVLVIYVLLLNVAITIFLLVWNFQMFVYNYGHYRQFITVDYASFFYLIDALVRFPVSSFFAERAYRMSGNNKVLAAILSLLLFASLSMGVTAKVISSTAFGTDKKFIVLSCVWLGCHLACDMITTATISIYLYRSKTGWSQTDALMMQLLVMTAETQLPPTILSTAFLITYIALPSSSWPVFFVFSAKVFGICLVAVMNTKFTLRREMEASSSSGGGANNTYALRPRNKTQSMQVHVVTDTYRERDVEDAFHVAKSKRGHPAEMDVVQFEEDAIGRIDHKGFNKLSDGEESSVDLNLPQVRFHAE